MSIETPRSIQGCLSLNYLTSRTRVLTLAVDALLLLSTSPMSITLFFLIAKVPVALTALPWGRTAFANLGVF